MASAVQLSSHDSHVLNLLFDAESTQASEQSVHGTDSAAKKKGCEPELHKREKSILTTLNMDNPDIEAIDAAINDLTELINEKPGYASAYNNRAQARRMKHGDDALLTELEALAEIVKDLAAAIELSTPQNDRTVLESAHTHRGLLTYKASKLPTTQRQRVAQVMGLQAEDLEAAASKDFHLGGRYGNRLAHQLSVYTNPYAKLCGQMHTVKSPVRSLEEQPSSSSESAWIFSGVLQQLAETYNTRLASQGLFLFDIQKLPSLVSSFNSLLLYSFLALLVRFTSETFYHDVKDSAASFYARTAKSMLLTAIAHREIPPTRSGSLNGEAPDTGPQSDLGIGHYSLKLVSMWAMLMGYLKQTKLSANQLDPWMPNSAYNEVASQIFIFETIFPHRHRFNRVVRTRDDSRRGQPQPPSFLQHTVDQATLHSRWITRLIDLCSEKGFLLANPFLGHITGATATVQFFFCFSTDTALANSGAENFKKYHRVDEKLNKLAEIIPQPTEGRSKRQLPRVSEGLIWSLLDYAASSTPTNGSSDQSGTVDVNMDVQFLSPPNAEASSANELQNVPRGEAMASAEPLQTLDDTLTLDLQSLLDIRGYTFMDDYTIGGQL
ncbi:hypothetical protein DV738_g2215, partial [Chaetothyriales sp. CBS 135597]